MKKKPQYKGKGVILFSPHQSTTGRLHEIKHKQLKHEPGNYTPEELVDHEIEAEKGAFETMGRPITARVGIPALVDLIERWNMSPKQATSLVIDRMRLKGILVGKDEREDLMNLTSGNRQGDV